MADDWLANVTESLINPEPIILEETDIIVNDFLSPSKLKEISGQTDLAKVETIEMIVNTTEISLGNFGQYLPRLLQLKLNDSVIPSVRDIGTSFDCLKVLWVSRCGLNDIDGIASMQCLQELYIAYNNIEDISPISFLDSLEVLDIEGNKVSDVGQIDYLSIMSCLTTLTISGNPICQIFKDEPNRNLREFILEKLPQLQQLDDEDSSGVCDSNLMLPTTSPSQEELETIVNAIKSGTITDAHETFEEENHLFNNAAFSKTKSTSPELLPSPFPSTTASIFNKKRPSTASPILNVDKHSEHRKFTSPVNPNRPGSSGSDSGTLQMDDSSILTFGNPLCGNPIHALRNRKKSPLPVMTLLNHEMNKLVHKPSKRPSTSIGLRRPIKVTDEDQWNSSDFDLSSFPMPLTPNNNNDILSNSEVCSHEKPDVKLLEQKGKVLNQSKTFEGNTLPLSLPLSKTSPSPPFSSPTPPQSPQRPQSAHSARSFRRPFSARLSQPTDIMTIQHVSNQFMSKEHSRSPIKDHLT